MKRMKKILAMLLALTMVLGMGLTSMAANVPDGTQETSATVGGVESGATVTAYQIVEGSYNENGLLGYDVVKDEDGNALVEIANPKAPTSDEITEIAKDVSELTSVEMTENDGVYSGDLTAGLWVVLVTKGTAEDAVLTDIYNPMLLGVWYSTSGSSTNMSFDPVSADESWTLKTTDAYAKSSAIDITKEIDDNEAEIINDTVNYTVTTTIPSYSEQYEEITYIITDRINDSLAYVVDESGSVDLGVTVGGTPVDAVTSDGIVNYSVDTTGNSFVITFDADYLKAFASSTFTDAQREVVLTYSATLTNKAATVAGANTVELEYTTVPGETNTDDDTEYVYTFNIDDELTKQGEDDDADALGGATFTLYAALREDETAYTEGILKEGYTTLKVDGTETAVRVVNTMTTEADGDIKFVGLDADLTYYLKETAAPNGYSLNDEVFTITFANVVENEETWTYEVHVNGSNDTVNVPNTKLNSLPSTGGIGTTIFTVAGCGIMIAAAYFFFASRKKEN